MKNFRISFLSIPIFLLLLSFPASKLFAQPGVSVSYQTFYDDLSPYGTWVDDPKYGNVWVPNEGSDFRPYHTHGHWVLTDYGNTWVSDDSWGWAPYHYGRWTYDPYYGWLWVPGYEWAPAWVSWRYSDSYCGWAPLSPGISIGVSYNCPNDWWVFVGPQYLYRPDYGRYWRGPRYNDECIRQTNFINNTYVDNGTRVRYNYGPRPTEIQRVTHQQVPVYRLAPSSRAGASSVQGNSVAMYRPQVKQVANARPDPGHSMRAPQPIGRPQAATVNANRAPAFHAAMQQQRQAPQQQGRPQAPPQQPMNRPQPQQGRPDQQRQAPPQQPMNRPQQQQGRPDQQRQAPSQQPMNRPQPQQGRPEPQRQAPPQQPMNRPQAQPMQRQEPQRQAPPPQRAEPPREAPREAPQEHERR